MWMIQFLFSVLFPNSCFGCRKEEIALCSRCIQLARKNLSQQEPFIISTFDFRDPLIKKCIHAIKYYGRKDLVEPLAAKLAQELETFPNITSYTLVPIPMPRLRKWARGYNQAELIARHLSKKLSLPIKTDLLKRKHASKRQVETKTKQERLQNQENTFIAHDAKNMHIILIDDVSTTGSTITNARNCLLHEKAASVHAATLAH